MYPLFVFDAGGLCALSPKFFSRIAVRKLIKVSKKLIIGKSVISWRTQGRYYNYRQCGQYENNKMRFDLILLPVRSTQYYNARLCLEGYYTLPSGLQFVKETNKFLFCVTVCVITMIYVHLLFRLLTEQTITATDLMSRYQSSSAVYFIIFCQNQLQITDTQK